MDFGNYAVIKNAQHKFREQPDWYWEFKPITAGDELAMTIFIQKGRPEKDFDGNTVYIPHSGQAIAMREVALSFAGTNIPKNNSSKAPVLTASSTIEEIENVLKEMPHQMFKEVWEALGETYPFWGPAEDGTKKSTKEKA